MSDVNQDEIDALLGAAGQTVEDDTGGPCSVDDVVAQALSEQSAVSAPEVAVSQEPEPVVEVAATATPPAPSVAVDTSALAAADSFEQARAAQKILFEVFSSIADKKERARLINWANDAFIKSKYF